MYKKSKKVGKCHNTKPEVTGGQPHKENFT